MIRNILVPTDGSDHAVKATTFAADIAAKYKARMVLFHSLLVHVGSGEILGLLKAGQVSEATQTELEHAANMLARVQSVAPVGPKGIPLSTDVLEQVGGDVLKSGETLAREHGAEEVSHILTNGEPIQCILRAIDDENIDLIVMGSRGLGDLEGLLVGSVSHKVGQLADCTVVTVK
ncbi:MAG: universal stress protein [Alphaproteobacteria bacterium]